MANEQEDLTLQNNSDNILGTPANTGDAGEDAVNPTPPWREILERLKQQEGKMATEGVEIALQKEHIQRLESENGQMKVVLEGYQRPPHAEETVGEKGNLAIQEAPVHHRDQPRRTRDEVEEITEEEALRTTPRKRTMDPTVAGNPSTTSKETERLQEMMWNKLIALEAKSQMGVHSEWARMEWLTLSPFGNHILRVEAPQRYVAPKLPEYNGTGDPSEYVCQFEQKMLTVSVPLEDLEAIKCKTFTQGLRGPALHWFHNLPSGTVNSYQDLILRFQANFAISVRTAKVDTDLMLIHQHLDEPLEHFINRFSEEYVSILKCTDSVAIKALMQGLIHGSELKKEIIVEPGLSLTRALTMARGYVAYEVEEKRHNEEVSRETLTSGDTFLFESKNRTPAARPHNRTDNRSANERNTRGTVMVSMGEAGQPHAQRGEKELPRMTITLTELIRRLRGLKETKWPPRMTMDPVKRDKGRYCAFHGEHGHATYECRQLKIEVNRLVKEGFFWDCLVLDVALHIQRGSNKSQDQSPPPYIKKTVNVISGGSDLSGNLERASMAHARRVQSVRAMTLIDSDGPDVLLSFNRGEASELEHPHDDALVITLDVAHVRMKRMLVDTRSSANILFAGVLKEMEIKDLKAQDTQVTLGEVREIRGDQLGARECYSSSLRSKNKL
ncbi:hypothetical protein G4B88_000798 [Cannabis sativa]|uniref:Retrotransposon gag domain-containing protein n=1 Tax=Cannabis sativa TaxID=3483 RepID=A0A7J6I526_CANSA|nr:hypothetical protein G4B88_000798 [Cannabis sativa]